MTGNKKIENQPSKILKYKSFAKDIEKLDELDKFLNGIDKKYEVISITNPYGAKSSMGWQFIVVTKYYE